MKSVGCERFSRLTKAFDNGSAGGLAVKEWSDLDGVQTSNASQSV